ncbi:ribbon-helix-helix protein, CopG family [Streptomyces sp. RKND-216]|uniref:FitA-like ribbon-helix-helix domain-containing protein n=1 Tax=Streptomyces sp. RKND-216 TaxID=2562581 RepID=UPI00109DE368|nr:ribbon-helix-helix protein, CopG family [Streptomyces sp. RKND-216]THA26188.1 ribbon-helix-helix protein, CopG family [Streptomyces sp. RKND-216]
MAMNVRFDDDQTQALKKQAEREGRSMQAVVRRAVDDYLARNARDAMVRESAIKEAAKWHELLERLK